MKKYSVVLLVVALIIVIASWFISLYNGLIKKDEAAQAAWSQVENVYQRRMDLVPNLVNTVKGAADFERATLEDVVSARASASQVKIDANTLTEENIAAFQKAQDALSGSLSRLLLTVERYPELKATENFRDLQAQLEGTEN
ncbi:MAG: LemA family protein, partial [Lentimicrobiaceae bacterium]|nr:LemA family protein [Lentimicrobiaceae bacterium]